MTASILGLSSRASGSVIQRCHPEAGPNIIGLGPVRHAESWHDPGPYQAGKMRISSDPSPDTRIFQWPKQPQPQKQQPKQGAAKTPGEDLDVAASARQVPSRKTPGEDAAPALPRVPDGFFVRFRSAHLPQAQAVRHALRGDEHPVLRTLYSPQTNRPRSAGKRGPRGG